MNWWFSKNIQKQVFTYIKVKDIVKGSESKKIKLIKAKEYLIGIEAKKLKFKLIVNFIASLLSFKIWLALYLDKEFRSLSSTLA